MLPSIATDAKQLGIGENQFLKAVAVPHIANQYFIGSIYRKSITIAVNRRWLVNKVSVALRGTKRPMAHHTKHKHMGISFGN